MPVAETPALLTIITRTYGQREGFLQAAAASVFGQLHRPIEWLIVEDGPSAAGEVIAAADVPEGIAVRVLTNPKLGRSAAANRGLDEATGAAIMFFDDDDELFPNHGSCLMDLLERHPLAAGAYSAAIEAERATEEPGAQITAEKIHFRPMASSGLLLRANPFPIQAVVFRRSCVFHQRFDTRLDALEDWLFWTEIFLERDLVWTPEITSRFYVPASKAVRKRRLKSHRDAERDYSMQAEALFAERGLWRWGEVVAHADRQLGDLALLARSELDIA
jgi:glycosyltransferase involved in cell wall biosynthesis